MHLSLLHLEEQWFCGTINSQLTGKSSAAVVLAWKSYEHIKTAHEGLYVLDMHI